MSVVHLPVIPWPAVEGAVRDGAAVMTLGKHGEHHVRETTIATTC